MKAWIVAGSPEAHQPAGLPDADAPATGPAPGDLVIAVDAGLLHAQRWGWPVALLIGDLDSLAEAHAAPPAGVELITAPPAKDLTDLEMAVAEAVARGADEIIICAALGGRTDHLLANVLLLARPDLAGRVAVLADGPDTLRLLAGGETVTLSGAAGDLLSLLPIGGPAAGVITEDLAYPLADETLALGEARGVSNVFLSARARVSLRAGRLLVFHRRIA